MQLPALPQISVYLTHPTCPSKRAGPEERKAKGLTSPGRRAGFSRPEKRYVLVFSSTADTSSPGPFISLSFPRGIIPNSLALGSSVQTRNILAQILPCPDNTWEAPTPALTPKKKLTLTRR